MSKVLIDKTPHYDRYGLVPIDEVIPMILEELHDKTGEPRRYFLGQQVKVVSLRLRTFARKGITCVECGLTATHFALERDFHHKGTDTKYHLNLWHISPDREVLFTHDHILARGLGGADNLSNTQTMCGPDNWTKGLEESKQRAELLANGIDPGRIKNGKRRKV